MAQKATVLFCEKSWTSLVLCDLSARKTIAEYASRGLCALAEPLVVYRLPDSFQSYFHSRDTNATSRNSTSRAGDSTYTG